MLLSYTYALVSACLPALGLGAIARQPSAAELYARADKPNFPYDKNTTPYCSFWYDNDESMSCQDIISVFAIPMEKFVSWVSELGHAHFTPYPVMLTRKTCGSVA